MTGNQPPLDFFLSCSDIGLESYELSRLQRAACLRKELQQVLAEWIEAAANARIARLLLQERQREVPAHADADADSSAGAPPRLASGTPPRLAQNDSLPQRLACKPAPDLPSEQPAATESAKPATAQLPPGGSAPEALRRLLRVPAPPVPAKSRDAAHRPAHQTPHQTARQTASQPMLPPRATRSSDDRTLPPRKLAVPRCLPPVLRRQPEPVRAPAPPGLRVPARTA